MNGQKKDGAQRPDAGMRSLDHYKTRLPAWRYSLRNILIPIIRSETPYLVKLQEKCRTPALDSYFAFTANLGTHTFFMIILPILYWCGNPSLGRAMVHILASGVYASGVVKDMLCLPRPISPPLLRISRSQSAAMEYGFPSTHSTNAVSVAVYAISAIRSSPHLSASIAGALLQVAFAFYAISIVFGRVYCGMHGFFDIVIGSTLGALLAAIQCFYGELFDQWILSDSFNPLFLVTVLIMVLVRTHPEPADDCPCFDDSVAFSGVGIGIEIGNWHLARFGLAGVDSISIPQTFNMEALGWLKAALRVFLGVFIIFAWRGFMKPSLLKGLPPIFRIIERLGLALPRRFFLMASQYNTVPHLRKDDNLIPPASDIPAMISSLRNPRRRAVSFGPQSEADAHEVIAYREHRRQQSLTLADRSRSRSPLLNESGFEKVDETQDSLIRQRKPTEQDDKSRTTQFNLSMANSSANGSLDGAPLSSARDPNDQSVVSTPTAESCSHELQEKKEDIDDIEMFSQLQKPRVRYDVEVVTKMIVYTGIGWLATEGLPVLFELVGLEATK